MVDDRVRHNMRKQAKGVSAMLVLLVCICLIGCSKLREEQYYSDFNNFITEEAIVKNIIYDDQQEYIVLWLSEIDDSYQTGNFMIEGVNFSIAIEKGILDKIEIGDEITFTSAPRYFGNGYFMPIVGLSIGEEEILNIEEGYENLMKSY